jgi:ribose/xylose/arabinose/galactoside ABC-type transport system permease subunit
MQSVIPASRQFAYAIIRRLLLANKAFLFLIILAAYFSFASRFFLTSTNLFNVLEQVSVMMTVAVATTLILGAGEIDLSIGAMVGFVGVVMGNLMVSANLPYPIAIAGGLTAGALCGVLNATLISKVGLPPFIVTLATGSLYTGLIYLSTNLVPISNLPRDFVVLGQGYVGPVPIPVIVTAVAVTVAYLVGSKTVFGTHVIALGGNPEAVRLAGINVTRVRLGIYVFSGIYCAIASVLLTAISASAQIGAGSDLLLNVIAGVVIGGTPLMGGKVLIIGTIFGCAIMQVISNGLVLVGINPNYQVIAQGGLILAALIVEVQSARLLERMAKPKIRIANGGQPATTGSTGADN